MMTDEEQPQDKQPPTPAPKPADQPEGQGKLVMGKFPYDGTQEEKEAFADAMLRELGFDDDDDPDAPEESEDDDA